MGEVFRHRILSENVLFSWWNYGHLIRVSNILHIPFFDWNSHLAETFPFKASVNDATEFLVKIVRESKCEYSANNAAMSVLLFPIINDISLLLKGMFKERPWPRYTFIFDVKPIFKYIKEISCSDGASLDIHAETLPTTMRLFSG